MSTDWKTLLMFASRILQMICWSQQESAEVWITGLSRNRRHQYLSACGLSARLDTSVSHPNYHVCAAETRVSNVYDLPCPVILKLDSIYHEGSTRGEEEGMDKRYLA